MKRFLLRLVNLRTYILLSRLRHFAKKNDFPVLNIVDVFEIISQKNKISFIQVGAYDGVSNDPVFYFIKTYNWKGVLIEPVQYIYQKLQETYKGIDGLHFENVGIADRTGEMDFYSLPKSFSEPDWLQQLGTFDKHSIEFNLATLPDLIPQIETKKIKAVRLTDILEKYKIEVLDVLAIDAEGYEYNILKSLPEIKQQPRIILFEWGSMDTSTYSDLLKLLNQQHYSIFKSGGDMIAIKKQQ